MECLSSGKNAAVLEARRSCGADYAKKTTGGDLIVPLQMGVKRSTIEGKAPLNKALLSILLCRGFSPRISIK